MRDLDGSSPWLRTRIEREFELVRRLDPRGPGECWLATRDDGHQQAILRVIPRETISHDQAAALESDLARATQLPPHPHLAPVLAADTSGARLVFAAACVEGDDLASLVEQTGPLPPDAAVECLRQGLLGLLHAHRQGVAHGDLKLSDLLLDFDGILKICNWGCAALNGRCDFAAAAIKDLRALAAALTWLLTGQEMARTSPSGQCPNGAHARAELSCHALTACSEKLITVHARLAAAGTDSGFASAEEALAALEDADAAGDTAAEENADGDPRSGPNELSPAASAPTALSVSANDVTPAAATSAENLLAAALDSSMEDRPAAATEQSSVSPPRNRSLLWCGSLALSLLMLLALVGYLLWR
jgi:serine/threonine protein kinase